MYNVICSANVYQVISGTPSNGLDLDDGITSKLS